MWKIEDEMHIPDSRIGVEKDKQRCSNIIKKFGKNYRPLNVKYYQEGSGIEKSIAIGNVSGI
ncbi:21631_t:CDS:2 [Dentiscutata erythropus]|uniref:21631_t:CDS:1 n=1 Tax=Dentiscutata erythropus TaxID=1348616 RepID=A0A9N9I881_9GLOM|nr:21631_t:CDS:2 [Dentiscutata erythropus]